jgi:hypothetical protein
MSAGGDDPAGADCLDRSRWWRTSQSDVSSNLRSAAIRAFSRWPTCRRRERFRIGRVHRRRRAHAFRPSPGGKTVAMNRIYDAVEAPIPQIFVTKRRSVRTRRRCSADRAGSTAALHACRDRFPSHGFRLLRVSLTNTPSPAFSEDLVRTVGETAVPGPPSSSNRDRRFPRSASRLDRNHTLLVPDVKQASGSSP